MLDSVTAVVVVSDSGRLKVSAEIVRESEPLDLSGEWVGRQGKGAKLKSIVRLSGGQIRLTAVAPAGMVGMVVYETKCECVDEGNGKLRLNLGDLPLRGIYKQNGDRVMICYHDDGESRPVSFRPGNGQHLLILRRVKPSK